MIDQVLLRQLASGDPEIRRVAIMALGRSRDPEALPHLAQVFRSDSKPELRDLARKAGIFIRKALDDQHEDDGMVSPSAYLHDDDDDDEIDQIALRTKPAVGAAIYDPDNPSVQMPAFDSSGVSKEDREWADYYLREAWHSFYQRDIASAKLHLEKAYKHNAKLFEAEDARDAASRILKQPPDLALRMLSSGKSKKGRGKKEKTQTRRSATSETSDGNGSFLSAIVDLILITVLNFALIYALGLLTEAFIRQVYSLALTQPDSAQAVSLLRPLITAYDNGSTLLGTLIVAGGQAVFHILWYFMIHLSATTFMGGDGTVPRLTRHMLYYTVIANLAVLGLGALIVTALRDVDNAATLALIVATLLALFLLGGLIGRAYRFDIGRGLVTLLISLIGYALVAISIGLIANVLFSEQIATLLGSG